MNCSQRPLDHHEDASASEDEETPLAMTIPRVKPDKPAGPGGCSATRVVGTLVLCGVLGAAYSFIGPGASRSKVDALAAHATRAADRAAGLGYADVAGGGGGGGALFADGGGGDGATAGFGPDVVRVRFDVQIEGKVDASPLTTQSFIVRVHRDWAPLGAKRFLALVRAHFFDDARFFRVVPRFVAQFGLASTRAANEHWKRKGPLKDDPVKHSNKRGTVTFATSGANSRTTQLFVNFGANGRLDGMGFAPFAEVEGDGMAVVDRIYAGDREKPNQGSISARGNAYLKKEFPNLSYIASTAILHGNA